MAQASGFAESAAGSQPVTHEAGLALATRFQLGENGSRHVDEALSQLKQYHGFENVLWFGFGYKSFVRLLADSQLGVNCIALCALSWGSTSASNAS